MRTSTAAVDEERLDEARVRANGKPIRASRLRERARRERGGRRSSGSENVPGICSENLAFLVRLGFDETRERRFD